MSKARAQVRVWSCVGIYLVGVGLILLCLLAVMLICRHQLEIKNNEIARLDARYTQGICNIPSCSFTNYQPDNSVLVELLLQPVTQLSVIQPFQKWIPLEKAVNLCHYINQTGCYYDVDNATKYCSLNRWVSPTNFSEKNGYGLFRAFFWTGIVLASPLTVVILIFAISRSIRLALQKQGPYDMIDPNVIL